MRRWTGQYTGDRFSCLAGSPRLSGRPAFGLRSGQLSHHNNICLTVHLTTHCPADIEKEKMFAVVNKLKSYLKKYEIPFIDSGSHIIPVIIGDAKLCKRASNILLDEFNIYVQPINFPTVPRGTERLRITASPNHTDKMVKDLATALKSVFNQLNIVKAA